MRPYDDESIPCDRYRPAYRHGWEARAERIRSASEDVEAELRMKWESARPRSKLSRDKPRSASRDA
jgi:hypothetical protein